MTNARKWLSSLFTYTPLAEREPWELEQRAPQVPVSAWVRAL
jgi:hypothetical protein